MIMIEYLSDYVLEIKYENMKIKCFDEIKINFSNG